MEISETKHSGRRLVTVKELSSLPGYVPAFIKTPPHGMARMRREMDHGVMGVETEGR